MQVAAETFACPPAPTKAGGSGAENASGVVILSKVSASASAFFEGLFPRRLALDDALFQGRIAGGATRSIVRRPSVWRHSNGRWCKRGAMRFLDRGDGLGKKICRRLNGPHPGCERLPGWRVLPRESGTVSVSNEGRPPWRPTCAPVRTAGSPANLCRRCFFSAGHHIVGTAGSVFFLRVCLLLWRKPPGGLISLRHAGNKTDVSTLFQSGYKVFGMARQHFGSQNSAVKVLLLYPEFPDTFWSFTHLEFIRKNSRCRPSGLLTVGLRLRRIGLNAS